MGNLRPFQIVIIGAFIALAVAGAIVFASFRGFDIGDNPYGESVEIWGTLDSSVFETVLREIADADENFRVVFYVEKDPRMFSSELTNAIAEGRGPDAVVLPHTLLLSERGKLFPIPYDTLSDRDFRDTYIDGASIFQLAEGTYGFPFAVDPLVMYWNRDLYSTAGIAAPPGTWEEVLARIVPALTALSANRDVTQSALSFGEYGNVRNAKEVLVMLMLQAGSLLVAPEGGGYVTSLNSSAGDVARPPADAALDFYTQFANKARTTYTWNRSLPEDRQMFLANDLATYFGFGSEYRAIRAGNPNLNFDLARVPQGSGVTTARGYGAFYSLSLLRSSDNPNGTFQALALLGRSDVASALAANLELTPVHRSTLAGGTGSAVSGVLYQSALVSRGWLDPNPAASDNVFNIMIGDVTSGRSGVSGAVRDAETRLNQLLR